MRYNGFILLNLLFSLLSGNGFAASITCTGVSAGVGGDYAIPGMNITSPNNPGSTFRIYLAKGAQIGQGTNPNCNRVVTYYYSMTDLIGPSTESGGGGNYVIYPTNTTGLGVSVNDGSKGYTLGSGTSEGTVSLPIWPNGITVSEQTAINPWFDIRLWKSYGITSVSGPVNFTGPAILQYIKPKNAGDTFAQCPAGSEPFGNNICILMKRTLKGSANFISGTCRLQQSQYVVNMGRHYGGNGQNSSWIDASFRVTDCPHAWGYGASTYHSTNSNDNNNYESVIIGNSQVNNSVTVWVRPYITGTLSEQQNGIFPLDPGGATGYGIQLAWGGTSQGAVPTDPVDFTTPRNARSLNNNFINGPYASGGKALPDGADGTINMAARYVRTSGTINSGPANGRVEVLVSYE